MHSLVNSTDRQCETVDILYQPIDTNAIAVLSLSLSSDELCGRWVSCHFMAHGFSSHCTVRNKKSLCQNTYNVYFSYIHNFQGSHWLLKLLCQFSLLHEKQATNAAFQALKKGHSDIKGHCLGSLLYVFMLTCSTKILHNPKQFLFKISDKKINIE